MIKKKAASRIRLQLNQDNDRMTNNIEKTFFHTRFYTIIR